MKRILVPIDLSPETDRVLDQAAALATVLQDRLVLLHVAAPDPDFVGFGAGPDTVRKHMADRYHEEHRAVQAAAERLRTGGLEVTAMVVQGPTVETILHEAGKLGADLIVMGSHGHGAVYHLLVGSVSEGVLRHSTVPVLLVPTRRRTA